MNKITEDFFYPFAPADVTRVHTVVLRMIEFGVTAGDVSQMVEEYVAEYHTNLRASNVSELPDKRRRLTNAHKTYGVCPLCNSELASMAVNTNTKDQIDGNFNRMLFCKNSACAYNHPFKG